MDGWMDNRHKNSDRHRLNAVCLYVPSSLHIYPFRSRVYVVLSFQESPSKVANSSAVLTWTAHYAVHAVFFS